MISELEEWLYGRPLEEVKYTYALLRALTNLKLIKITTLDDATINNKVVRLYIRKTTGKY